MIPTQFWVFLASWVCSAFVYCGTLVWKWETFNMCHRMSESLYILAKFLHWLKELIVSRLRTCPVPLLEGLDYNAFFRACASQVVQADQLSPCHHPTQKNKKQKTQEALWGRPHHVSFHILKIPTLCLWLWWWQHIYYNGMNVSRLFMKCDLMGQSRCRVHGSTVANLKGPTPRSLFERQSRWSLRSHGMVEWTSKSSSVGLENPDHLQYFSLPLRSRGIRIRKLSCYKTATHSPEFT